MIKIRILKDTDISEEEICPYFSDRLSRNRYMFATDLTRDEFGRLLKRGWRRFGIYYFRPICKECNDCIPIRVPVDSFTFSRGQKRVWKKNSECRVIFKELTYSDDLYDLYEEHSNRFEKKESSKENFIQTFFFGSAPAYQTEYYIDEELAACGFLDAGTDGLSSVYFIYKEKFSHLSLGTFGALKEIELVKSLGLTYYYLGYYIKENRHMNYKAGFKPHQLYNWGKEEWLINNE